MPCVCMCVCRSASVRIIFADRNFSKSPFESYDLFCGTGKTAAKMPSNRAVCAEKAVADFAMRDRKGGKRNRRAWLIEIHFS